jgi:two-component system OmpR family response regulator
MFSILVVEDDENLNKLMCEKLRNETYKVFPAFDGEEAMEVLDTQHIDLMVSDIMMPNMNGYELTKQLRDAAYTLPILMITAKDQMEDMEKGFIAGTDDYMVKPINLKEMLLRVKALLRRAQIVSDHKLIVGNVVLDYDAVTVKMKEEIQELPPKEFYLLFKLLSYPNKIFTRQELMDEIWGMNTDIDDRTVDSHIKKLRRRYENLDDFEIVTVRGLGYKVRKNDDK